jgi:hypothetical protein
MSKPIHFLFAALFVGIAPKLGAQAVGREVQVTIPRATAARMVAVPKKAKGRDIPHPPASQRAPDRSKLTVVIGPDGVRRFARPVKPIK